METRAPRVVVVWRPSALQGLLDRHATIGQVRFFLERRGQSLELVQQRHTEQEEALLAVEHSIPNEWRRSRVQRAELDRFLFEPDDLVVVVGQDGLVANVAKYLTGQPVIGLNPSPDWYDGVLVRHPPAAVGDLLADTAKARGSIEERTMVEARLDDGQRLLALNELFVGHGSHQSARYRLRDPRGEERQSSSGLIVATGTGATGWARSIHRERASDLKMPMPSDDRLVYFVREAFPSVATGTERTEGVLGPGESLEVISEMDAGGSVFGDGIEIDRLEFAWGQRVVLQRAANRLRLTR